MRSPPSRNGGHSWKLARVAIKVISPDAVSGVGIRRFLTVVGYVACLERPHITLYEAVRHPERR
jgi:hypothetical protein